MGLLSAIAGPVVGAVASGILGSRERKQRRSDAKAKFSDLRKSAEKAGFNPLTALMATGGQGFGDYGASIPPLATANFLSSAAASVAKEMTGEAATQRAEDRARAELAELSLEQMRSGVANVGGTPSPLRVANPTKMYVGGPDQPRPQRLTSNPSKKNELDYTPSPFADEMRDVDDRGLEGQSVLMQQTTGLRGGKAWYGLNPEYFEIGPGEMLMGAIRAPAEMILNDTADKIFNPQSHPTANQDFWLPPLSTGPFKRPQT